MDNKDIQVIFCILRTDIVGSGKELIFPVSRSMDEIIIGR